MERDSIRSSDMRTTSLTTAAAVGDVVRASAANDVESSTSQHYEDKDNEFHVYTYRFFILIMFASLEMSNALMWVTYAPISDIAMNYFGGKSYYGSTTGINMMANIFLILYGPGTLLAVYMMKTFKLKRSLEIAGFLTVIGALIRYLAAVFDNHLSYSDIYWLMFFGQCLSAIAQPMFLNSPPMIAAIWFPVKERDLATTIGSMCSPIGNAIGQLIPVFLVSQSSKSHDDDDNYEVHGMENLMLVELILCIVPLIIGIIYLKDEPLTAPSKSTKLKNDNRSEKTSKINAIDTFLEEASILFHNRDYVLLFIAFSIGVGFFNSLLTLLNQIISPFGYTNDDAGTFAAVFILFGLFGAGCIGVIMEKTRAYRTLLKIGIFICVLINILFICMLFSNNYWPLMITFALLGFFILPLLPIMMENCAECTYPVGEEVSMGIMFVGSNILGLGFVFALQYLLEEQPFGPPPLLPSNIFIVGIIFFGFIILLFYQGEYKRLQNESLRDRLLSSGPIIEESPFHNNFETNDLEQSEQRFLRTQGSGRKDTFGKSFGSISSPIPGRQFTANLANQQPMDDNDTNAGFNSSHGLLYNDHEQQHIITPFKSEGYGSKYNKRHIHDEKQQDNSDGRIVRVTSTDSSNNTSSTIQGGEEGTAPEDSGHSYNFWARMT